MELKKTFGYYKDSFISFANHNAKSKYSSTQGSKKDISLEDGELSGSTWDAKHLDNFLKKQKYVQESSLQPRRRTDNNIQSSNNTDSYYFKSVQPKIDYLTLPGQVMFKSKYNPLVLNNQPNVGNSLKMNQKLTNVQPKAFDEKTLDYQLTENTLMTGKQRKEQLGKFKENQGKYQNWKQQIFDNTKCLKQIERSLQSGILNVDNPDMENSLIYKQQQLANDYAEQLKKNQREARKIVQNKFQQINPNVEFSNEYIEQEKTFKTMESDAKNRLRISTFDDSIKQFPHQDHFLSKEWKSKKQVIPTNNSSNVFGESQELNRNTSDRQKNLEYQDKRNKGYNIISIIKES